MIAPDRTRSYRQLDLASTRVAAWLRGRGVDATLPPGRSGRLLEDCGSPAVLGQSHRPVDTGLPVLEVDLITCGDGEEVSGDPLSRRDPTTSLT